MIKTNQQFKHKLLSFFTLMSLVLTWLAPIFSNKVLALSPKFTPTSVKKNTPSKEEIAESMSKMPIQFEQNRGQFDKKVHFALRRASETVFLTSTEAVFSQKISEKKNYALKMELLNANKDAKSYGSEEKISKTNYFRGNDPSKWQTDVSTFGRVNYEEVYQGIDLTWYGNADNDLEYDFIVKPNADYQQIRLKFKGAKSLKIADNGDLLIKTKYGTTTQRKPYTFQIIDGEKREVESRYELVGNNKVKFVVGEYDKSRDLVIDPTLLKYASYLGGTAGESIGDFVIDSQGNIYLTGGTNSLDFPTTVGSFDTTYNGSNNVSSNIYVSKIGVQGNLEYSTFLSGTNGGLDEKSSAMAVDSSGNVYIVGETFATDFPVTAGSYDTTKNGDSGDGFLTKLNPTGTSLIYSTYFGSTGYSDRPVDIIVNSNREVIVAGQTDGSSYPLTAGAFTGGGRSFYTKFHADGNALLFSTRINQIVNKIALDANNNSILVGQISSNGFTATVGAYDTTYNGALDAVIFKISINNLLTYASYLGGSSDDRARDIFIDSSGNVFIMISTSSPNFPKTPNSLPRPINSDSVVTKFASNLTSLLLSTNLGPNSGVDAEALSVDSMGDIYVWGISRFNSFGADNPGCSSNSFLVRYSFDATTIKNIKCFSANQYAPEMLIDQLDNVYILGLANSNFSSFPTTPNAIDRTADGLDNWIAKVKLIPQSIPYDFDADGKSDMAVYRNGTWHVNQSLWNYKAQSFGLATDTPVPADYDGDGKTDFSVWRPSDVSGQPDFYVLKSSTNTLQGVSWGTTTDTPVVADYDGDSKADFGVYRTTSGDGDFFVLNQTGTSRHYRFGISGDKPVVADYDGDGKADFAVFRPTTGTWYINNSTNNTFQYVNWGLGTDKLVPADYDGDGKTDVAVFRESEGMWYINQSSDGQMKYQQWGLSTDKLVPADYDGDGKTDIAVYRDGQWFVWQSSNNSPNYANVFGNATDLPVQSLAVK